MKRRNLIAAAALLPLARPALTRPALAQNAAAKTLVFVPATNLNSLDPIWTTATVTRNYSFLVFDTLYGVTAGMEARPQMAEGHTVDDDGLRWTVRLRPGLRFHDNEPVRARDCAASLARWMKRDIVGQQLATRLDAIETPDDRTLMFRLRKPFPALLFALARSQPNAAVMMPERLANVDAYKQLSEVVGSGPMRFVPGEYVSGSQAVFTKFENYRSRDEPADFTAGAKRMGVDRVEWRILPDPATQANALRAGEVDWVEAPLPDLLDGLRADRNLVVEHQDPFGIAPFLRLNHTQPPTSSLAFRQVVLAAVEQAEVMAALMGEDRTAYNAPVGMYMPTGESVSPVGMELVAGGKSDDELRKRLAASGYNGEKFLLMHPTDQHFYDVMTSVVSERLKRIGVNVDDLAMDYGTVVQRRVSKEPLAKGGWSAFVAGFPAVDNGSPLASSGLRANGAAAWFGWPDDPKLEALREAWMDAATPATRQKAADDIQMRALEQVMYVPLGQYFQSTAYRRSLTGVLKGPAPVFWNISKS